MAKPPAKPRANTVLPSHRLSLRDRLSKLTLRDAGKLLGSHGQKLIQKTANRWQIEIATDVHVGDDLFRVRFPDDDGHGPAVVTLTVMTEARQRIHFRCNRCQAACEHVVATFSLILEEKTSLGLAAAPPERPRWPLFLRRSSSPRRSPTASSGLAPR